MRDITGLNPLTYTGVNPIGRDFIRNRAPTFADNREYKVSDRWLDIVNELTYLKIGENAIGAIWLEFSSPGTGALIQLTPSSGSIVMPAAGNVNVFGTGSVTVTGSGDTLTINGGPGTSVSTLTGNTGGPVVAVSNNINILGSGNVSVAGAGDTLTISHPETTVSGDSGTAIPATNNVVLAGGTGITTTAAGNTVTIDGTTYTGDTGGALAPAAGNFNIVGSGDISVTGSGNTLTISSSAAGAVKQIQSASRNTPFTTTAAIPTDATIPQNTEGASFLTLAFTPTSASSTLKIEASGWGVAESASETLKCSICDTSIANALVAQIASGDASAIFGTVYMSIDIPAVSVATRTYDWRIGGNGIGNVSVGGTSSTAVFGAASVSTLRITEY